MGLVQDFIGRVSDQYRGTGPVSTNQHVHGGGFQSPNPALAGWLDRHPEIGERLATTSSAVAALEGMHEGALIATEKARETLDDAKAIEARAHHNARQLGQALDAAVAKRVLRTRQAAQAANEEAFSRSAVASNGFAASRDALNEAIKYVGQLAASRSDIVIATTVAIPKGVLRSIIAEQRATLIDFDIEKDAIESAPPPLDAAIAMVRASVRRDGPQINLGPMRVDWTPPKERLNVAPQLGDRPVDIVDGTAMLGWLLGDELADKLEAAVRARYIGVEKTYTPVERRTALSDVLDRRMQVEQIEVAAILAAWDDGNYIPLRKETSPAALLGVEGVIERAEEAGAGSLYLGEEAR